MKEQNVFKAGLGFGVMMAVFNVCFNLITAEEFTAVTIAKAFVAGLIGGFVGGLIYALLMRWMKKSKYLGPKVKFELDTDEEIIFQSGANYFKGIGAVGGFLTLTNKRLVFQSNYLNIQSHQLFIDLRDVVRFDRYKTLWIVNNGLLITTSQNVIEKFLVQQPENWEELLTKNLPKIAI